MDSGRLARHGMVEYSDSFRDRESQYRDIVDHANATLFVTGTALNNIVMNSWGKLIEKAAEVQVNLLMLDPTLADDLSVANLFDITYREGVLHSAQATLEKITSRIRNLSEARAANISLYLTKYFIPIAAAVADPNSDDGRMVVEVIGASDPNIEYFSRPRYVLSAASRDVSMFRGYWNQVSYLFSQDRATVHRIR
jgi:hypothetical protein